MKLNNLLAFTVLLALRFLSSWAVVGASKEKAKHGACPFIQPVMCLVSEPPQCHSDWDCPMKQKCCRHLCGIKCLDPVNTSKSVQINHGNCPVVIGRCKMIHPPNQCFKDSHCLKGLKCCKGICGNSCVKPL